MRKIFPVMALFSFCSASPAETQTNSAVRVPIEFRHDSLFVSARVNGSEPLSFKLDTGFGITTIHPGLVESLHLARGRSMTIVGIAGREQAETYSGAVFDFGGAIYSPRRVASIPSEAQRRGHKRDGILGSGFFRRFVVKIDSKSKMMTLREPSQFEYKGKGEIIPLEFHDDTPVVEAAINFTNRPSVRARFEIDTGCDADLCLGKDFVQTNRLAGENFATEGVRRGIGGSAKIRHGELPQFQLGKLKLDRLSANFFLEGSPAEVGFAGHIGMGVLWRYKVIFDYSRKQMILEPLR